MVTRSGHRWALAAAFAAAFSCTAIRPAAAQSQISFNGGWSIDPEQVYAGVSWTSPSIGRSFHLRPGIDGGFGEGLRLGTINIDLLAKFPLGNSGWTLLQGGGPTIVLVKFTGEEFENIPRELHAGGSYLFGFEHDKGFFTEFRIGGGDYVPGLKLGVGWSVEIK
jgi:hypothetical protein